MSKYTKGPWKLKGKIKGNDLNAWIFGKDIYDGIERDIQVISITDNHPIKEHNERRLADMKLISCAPEMYELLKDITNGTVRFDEIHSLLNRIDNE